MPSRTPSARSSSQKRTAGRQTGLLGSGSPPYSAPAGRAARWLRRSGLLGCLRKELSSRAACRRVRPPGRGRCGASPGCSSYARTGPGRCPLHPAASAPAPSRSTRRSRAASSGPGRGPCGRSRSAGARSSRSALARAAARSRARAPRPDSRATGTGSGVSAPRSARACCWRSAAPAAGWTPPRRPARNRDLEVRQDLEQHRLELLVGLVDLVDQQHHRLGGRSPSAAGGPSGSPPKRCPPGRRPNRVGRLGLDPQQLLAVVPLVQRLGLVESLVALQAHELAPE